MAIRNTARTVEGPGVPETIELVNRLLALIDGALKMRPDVDGETLNAALEDRIGLAETLMSPTAGSEAALPMSDALRRGRTPYARRTARSAAKDRVLKKLRIQQNTDRILGRNRRRPL